MSIYELLRSKNNFAFFIFGEKMLFCNSEGNWVVTNKTNNKTLGIFNDEAKAVNALLGENR